MAESHLQQRNSNIRDVTVEIRRQAVTQDEFIEKYVTFPQSDKPDQCHAFCTGVTQYFGCTSRQDFVKTVNGKLPFLQLLRNYQWKSWLVGDVVSGLCVGMIHVPQSLGFSVLAGLPPVHGLYASIFPLLVYFLLGTCRHLSPGTMAVISIIIGGVVAKEVEAISAPSANGTFGGEAPNGTYADTNFPTTSITDAMNEKAVEVAVGITFLTGLIQIMLSLLKLGLVVDFMSPQFMTGFLTGAASHVVPSQLVFALGLSEYIPLQTGLFRVVRMYYYIITCLSKTNLADLIIAVSSGFTLIMVKECVNERFKSRLKMPIPIELIVVTTATLVSYLCNFNVRFEVAIVDTVPKGLPSPVMPNLIQTSHYFVDAFVIAVISYVISMSQVKLMCRKHGYPVDQNQELLAAGVLHATTAVFSGFAGAAAPPRTFTVDSSGGKSQASGLFSAGFIIIVCLFLAPLFEPLPLSVLGAIIIVALVPLFKSLRDIPVLWKTNKYDCAVWCISFLAVIILDIDIGLLIGLLASILIVVIRARAANVISMQPVAPSSDIFVPRTRSTQKEPSLYRGVHVLRFDSPVYFANVQNFTRQMTDFIQTETTHELYCSSAKIDTAAPFMSTSLMIVEELTVDARGITKNNCTSSTKSLPVHMPAFEKPLFINQNGKYSDFTNPDETKVASSVVIGNGYTKDIVNTEADSKEVSQLLQKQRGVGNPSKEIFILDLSSIPWFDTSGFLALKQLRQDFSNSGVTLYFGNCSVFTCEQLNIHNIDTSWGVFPTLNDAVAWAQAEIG